MPTYTVHEPPLRKGESVAAPERFVFVRDGFYFWAFVLSPVWLFVRRLWLALLIYVVFTVALAVALQIRRLSAGVRTFAEVLVVSRGRLRGVVDLALDAGAAQMEDARLCGRRGSRNCRAPFLRRVGASALETQGSAAVPGRPGLRHAGLARSAGRHPMSSGCFPSRDSSDERCHRRLRLRQSALGRESV